MATNEFLPFGIAAGANVLSQSEYQALAARSNGFSSGTANSKQLNKAWRQSSVIASVIAQYISDNASADVIDDGNTTLLLSTLSLAISNVVKATGTSWGKVTDKPTTVDGFGITDAMKLGAGGLMTVAPTVVGKVADLPGSQFIFTSDNTTDTPPGFVYSVGLHIKGPDNSSVDLFSSLVSEEYVIRRNYPTNPTPARRLWHDGNFNPGDKANKATTLGGYGISDAYTKNQTDSAISTATSNKADKATTLGGYGITNAYTTGQVDSAISNAVSGKADRANTLAGYGITNAYTIGQVDSALALKFDKSGGTINGATTVSTAAQSNSVPGFTVYTPGGAGASANLMLSTSISGAYLSHATGSNTVYIRNHASGYADVDAGDIYSFGARCHTTTSFLKPVTGQWVQLAGSNPVIPAGGTWAYQVTNYTSGGAATGAIAGIVAGGTAVGGANSNGFAWKISQ